MHHTVASNRTGGIDFAGNCKLVALSDCIDFSGGTGSDASAGLFVQNEIIESLGDETKFVQPGD